MMPAVIVATLLAIPLLGLVTFVQLLYLESLRLRTRDLVVDAETLVDFYDKALPRQVSSAAARFPGV